MPIIFIILKSVKKSSIYSTLLRYFYAYMHSNYNIEEASLSIKVAA